MFIYGTITVEGKKAARWKKESILYWPVNWRPALIGLHIFHVPLDVTPNTSAVKLVDAASADKTK